MAQSYGKNKDTGPGILTNAFGITPFGRLSVDFGQHEPVDIAEARRRIEEYEEALQRQKQLPISENSPPQIFSLVREFNSEIALDYHRSKNESF
jgi:hypothetical protein